MAEQDKIWKELYSYETEVFSFVKNAVVDADVARDLFQDIYLSAIKNMPQLDSQRSLKNWLFTVTRNRVINYYRSSKRREFSEIKEEHLQTRLKQSDEPELIQRVLIKLPERQKTVLLLREIDGFSYEEIGQHLEITVSSVTALLSRARENFQKNYIMLLLPDWFSDVAGYINISDIFRFINPFNPPLDIIEGIDKKRISYFASITEKWDRIRANFLNDSDLEYMISRLNLKKGQTTADLGCGTGFVSLPLAILGQKVFALDADQGMIDQITQTRDEFSLKNLVPVIGDLRQIPLRAARVDNIFLVLVLHHIPDPFLVIEACAGILKTNGNLVLVDFVRHRRRDLADQMHDLWLGFDPQSLKRRIGKFGLDLLDEGSFTEQKQLASFFQIWKKRG